MEKTLIKKIKIYVAITISLFFFALWNFILVYYMANKLEMNDFGKFYYSTIAVSRGDDLYFGVNPATFVMLSKASGMNFWNLNPPHFHLMISHPSG